VELVCCVWISEQTANFALHNIKKIDIYKRGGVFTARYAQSPYTLQIRFVFKRLMYILPELTPPRTATSNEIPSLNASCCFKHFYQHHITLLVHNT
jgi:hypothetical protein